MDAFSVSIAGGMKSRKTGIAPAIKIGIFFGSFQAVMPVIGWLVGELLRDFIRSIGHWIAFILLGLIGLKMVREALSKDIEESKDIINTKTLLMLSVATSIDALIVGITLSLLEIPFLLSIITIGVVTFILSLCGFLFGKQLGGLFGKKIEVLGGAALILIGFKILFEHL